jgi:hypothetical protein
MESDPCPRCRIRVRGRLSAAVLQSFEGLESHTEPVCTVLEGPIADAATLHALLSRVELLGLDLLEARVEPPAG